jgi:transcriptional regulator with XRE-family HTH domain
MERHPHPSRTRDPEEAFVLAVGHRIRQLREQANLTQQQLGTAAGIGSDVISRLENGHYQSPGMRTLFRIAVGLGVPPSALLTGTEPAHPRETTAKAKLQAVAARLKPADLDLLLAIALTIAEHKRTGG